MGVDTRRPPLPAPTEDPSSIVSSVVSAATPYHGARHPYAAADTNTNTPSELGTDLSQRTLPESIEIPEDGTPVTITTKKVRLGGELTSRQSQTSLLIEYFEGGKGKAGEVATRPSVRVKVRPSSGKKGREQQGRLEVTEIAGKGKSRRVSGTRRFEIGAEGQPVETRVERSEVSFSDESGLGVSSSSSRPPVEVEVLDHNSSEMSSDVRGGRYVPAPSDISSIPPDSLLDTTVVTQSPRRRRSRSLERVEVVEKDTLKAPEHTRSRSLSKERITQRVMEKIKGPREVGSSSRPGKERVRVSSKEYLQEGKSSRRRASKGRDYEDLPSGESSQVTNSHLSARSGYTDRSGTSKASSINNPKLLETVEDAIRRLILPELNALKEENKQLQNRSKFDSSVRDSVATTRSGESDEFSRRLSKSSSAPNVAGKPKVVLNRDDDNEGIVLSGDSVKRSKHRRSSKDSVSERSYERRSSSGTIRDEEGNRVHRKKSKEKGHHRLMDTAAGALIGGVLTREALKHHDSMSDASERRERRKHRTKSRDSRSKSRSRTASISESYGESYHEKEEIPEVPELPPMPMRSVIQDSEVTRDSILSADTDRPFSSHSSGQNTPTKETLVREVSRGSPRQVVSPGPQETSRGYGALGMSHANQSTGNLSLHQNNSSQSFHEEVNVSTKAKLAGLAAAGLGAVGILPRQYQAYPDYVSSREALEQHTPHRLSPIQSVASYQSSVVAPAPPANLRAERSVASISSAGQEAGRPSSRLSISTMSSSPSTKGARLRKRAQAGDYEKQQQAGTTRSMDPAAEEAYLDETPRVKEINEWFDQQHEENERYRRESFDSPDQRDSSFLSRDPKRLTINSTDSTGASYADRIAAAQDVKAIGAVPEYVHTPIAVESAVASLHEPSTLSVMSSPHATFDRDHGSYLSQSHEIHDIEEERGLSREPSRDTIAEEKAISQQRWTAIKDHLQAQKLSNQSLQQQRSLTVSPPQMSVRSQESSMPQVGATGIPDMNDPMPEIGHYEDDQSVSEVETNPSYIQGPIGGNAHENWSQYPSPPPSSGRDLQNHHDSHAVEAGLLGAGAGAILGGMGAKHAANGETTRSLDHQPSVESESYDHNVVNHEVNHNYVDPYPNVNSMPQTPGQHDEGYISSAQPHSPNIALHKYGNKPPLLFDDDGLNEFDDNYGAGAGGDYTGTKHRRHLSGNSHGMASPLYDAATGKGMDRIQSKDIVALMDHLTVRDAQRNARDTEILVTLVRSAAEMRNSFEQMKRFIQEQDRMIMGNTDKDADIVIQKLSGPRPQPLGSPRVPRRASETDEDVQTKRKNVFKRALKGLSMRSSNDLARIEDMLMQLLDEVEGLKGSNTLQPVVRTNTNTASINSYENLRTQPDPEGYEPEGHAGTNSTPNQSGSFSPASRQNIIHRSGYDGRRGSGHRISTVDEEDEDLDDHEVNVLNNQYDNNERMTTPTQEAYNSKAYNTPPQQPAQFSGGSGNEHTPKTESQKKHRSNNSSIFGIPRISRWSKTTASSVPENRASIDIRHKRPSSEASRSGTSLNMPYYADGYELQEDDRLRSTQSLAREAAGGSNNALPPRSPSPLIPEHELDDPKYQAHRNSLNLQHPQPRPGPTGRHQSALEFSALDFGQPATPDLEIWGSNPSLARFPGGVGNRLSGGGNLSPISSDGGYSERSASQEVQARGPPRPPKIRDEGPLVPNVPPKVPLQDTKPSHSSPLSAYGHGGHLAPIQEVRYSLESEGGGRPMNGSPRIAAMQSPQRKITGPRPMGSRSPSVASQQGQGQGQHLDPLGTVRRKPVSARSRESFNRASFDDDEMF